MIARPKISRNEWKMAEIGAFEVGNFALFCCPGGRGRAPRGRHAEAAEEAHEREGADVVGGHAARVAVLHGPVWNSNLQPDFNVSVCDSFDAISSAVLRELDESNRFVQKSAESTSI